MDTAERVEPSGEGGQEEEMEEEDDHLAMAKDPDRGGPDTRSMHAVIAAAEELRGIRRLLDRERPDIELVLEGETYSEREDRILGHLAALFLAVRSLSEYETVSIEPETRERLREACILP